MVSLFIFPVVFEWLYTEKGNAKPTTDFSIYSMEMLFCCIYVSISEEANAFRKIYVQNGTHIIIPAWYQWMSWNNEKGYDTP